MNTRHDSVSCRVDYRKQLIMDLSTLIRDVEDYPKPGILFRDITPLLANGEAMRHVTQAFADYAVAMKAEAIAGIEARGFIFAPAVAAQLGLPFIPVRKEGKLPYECVTHSYDLEYGSDTLQIHTDALEPGQRVVIVDDLIATGGTAGATVELVRKLKAIPAGAIFLIELDGLGGRDELEGRGVRVDALLRYEE